MTFDPDYRSNHFVYLFQKGRVPSLRNENGCRISRYRVLPEPLPRIDPESEFPIIEWRSHGHDGGDLAFGQDGMLYISTGDGTADSDLWVSGQTLDDLLGSVLRIDVRQAAPGKPYLIPDDNPFLDHPGARAEIWAYGLRNPWRMTADLQSGQIWVGNNGQDLWETAHLLRRGENYGWSVFEGSHPFYPNRQLGPTPHVLPTIEHPHSEFRSLTGGIVYRGQKWPELDGAYLYGDHSTGRIWAARHDGKTMLWHRELADTSLQVAGFALAPGGDILIVDYGGHAIHRLRKAPPQPAQAVPFPRKLSGTGLFKSLPDQAP
ncbi:MAG: PQQ-dependent sugar dehydrogenase, partial [Akkermansiaceae bacterium]|nr:PQQ-dependent sugar dehydrogenase [Akkermansiaceae bacterium]